MLPHVGDLMWIQSPGPETGSYSGFPAPYGGLPPPDGSYGGLPPPDGEAYGNGHAPLATSYDANSPSPPPGVPCPLGGATDAVSRGAFCPPPGGPFSPDRLSPDQGYALWTTGSGGGRGRDRVSHALRARDPQGAKISL